MGTPQAAVPTLERCLADGHEVVAVYSQPDRASGRGNRIAFSPVKAFAVERGLTICQPHKIKAAETLDEFRSHAADIAVVVAYGRILPETYLRSYALGAVNVHFSLLPKYRGAAPVNWAIVNGEYETGVTTMKMDAGLDTGAILRQQSVAIGPRETAAELTARLSELGADLLSETLATITTISPTEQDDRLATYAPILKREDGLIDWQLPAAFIASRIRGFQPFPTSFSSFRGTKFTIWDAVAESDVADGETPGTIVDTASGTIRIACGDGRMLAVEELQPEGKRRMRSVDVINGYKPEPGEQFGDV